MNRLTNFHSADDKKPALTLSVFASREKALFDQGRLSKSS